MKKLIFTLLIAFFASLLAVNAQNSSKLSYNSDGSVVLSEELKTKLKAKGISEADYMKRMAVRKPKNEDIKKEKPQVYKPLKVSKKKEQLIRSETNISSKEMKTVDNSLLDKVKELNEKFTNEGGQYKAVIKNIRGKQYIELISLNNSLPYTIKNKK